MADEMDDIVNDFIVETTESLNSLDEKLVLLEKDPDNLDLLNSVFRSAHTIKGAAGFLGFNQMVEVAHHAESLLNKLRQGQIKNNPQITDAILKAMDMLKTLLYNVKEKTGREEDIAGVLTAIKNVEASEPAPAQAQPDAVPQPMPETNAPAPVNNEDAVKEVSQSPSSFEEKEKPKMLGEVLLEKKMITEEQMQEALADQRGNEKLGDVLIRKGFIKSEDISAALSSQGRSAETSHETTIRVDIKRLDNVLNLVGELVLGRNRLMRLAGDLEVKYEDDQIASAIRETTSNINLVTTDLQIAVMKTRMQPIGRVFNKFTRMVRDLARLKNKDIELTLIGEDTELDKTIIEEIGDPLVHLVRNSVDHGIETPDVRVQMGKDPKGRLELSAHHQGNNIFITIEDDGRGIDPNVLREKAVEKGIMSREEAAGMNDKDILNVIFMPGFSTAKEITDVSGRGVGMDVVKTNVAKLNGSIDIDTEIGKGTRITVSLPLTLAIIQALMVEAGKEIYALPLSTVTEILRVGADEIKTVDKKEVIYVRNTVFPLARLSNLLDKPSECSERPYIVLITMGDKHVGIMVDALHGQEEIVIKSMGEYLSNTKGIAGATVTGNGQVVLILDIMGIFAQITQERLISSR